MESPSLSVIVPLYNSADYLADAIESVIRQTFGFNEHIELILVDDGSSDSTATVAQSYAKKFPDNIFYYYQTNNGVSSARNFGFAQARGEYIHFFDSDDILADNFYEASIGFLTINSAVDVVASRLMFFDEIIDSHPLNFKFAATRVIDLVHEPNNPILHVISAVFRRSAITKVKFDERLRIAEDVRFLSDVLVAKKKYGVVDNALYNYRKRSDGSSAIATRLHRKYNYQDIVDFAYTPMLKSWQDKKNTANAIEYTILYDLSYRLDQKTQTALDDSEEKKYQQSLLHIATSLSDEAVASNNYLNPQQKMFIFEHKYHAKLKAHLRVDGTRLLFDDYPLFDYRPGAVHLDFLTAEKSLSYKLEGYVGGYLPSDHVNYYAVVAGKKYPLKFVPRAQREQSFLGDSYDNGGAFEVVCSIPLRAELSFLIEIADQSIVPRIETGRFTKFGGLKWTYRREKARLWKREPAMLRSFPYSSWRHVGLELRMLFQIVLNWRLNTLRERWRKLHSLNLSQLSFKGKMRERLKPFFFTAEALYTIPRAVYLRSSYYIARRFKRRPIWLVSDRGIAAGDNGEALFRYIMEQKKRPADVYFVISKKSPDYERMRLIGPVLRQESLRYKLKFLLADKIIASQADVETTNPFIRQLDHYVDLFDFDFVFLQHGIIRHNLSAWLNRYEKNIRLFVTSARKEYQSIFDNPYYYPKGNVLLSGLPRYDYLVSEPAGKIILAPTYRKNLAKQRTNRIGVRGYDADFQHSGYFIFYNSLMNDRRLLEVMQKHGMTGEFCLHPAFTAQRSDFDESEIFKVKQYPYDYQQAFREGNMLISDHSSVVFDFAYLKKPVAYAHFDVDTFFENHTYDRSNFFSDTDDGFGGVYYDYETLLEGIIKTIETDCKMPAKYQKRVDNFFYRVDRNNCQRVYNAIIDLTKK